MRTTLSIDDDVLFAAKSLAAREQKTLGEIVSSLARQALLGEQSSRRSRNGVPLLAAKAQTAPITMALVTRLRDELA